MENTNEKTYKISRIILALLTFILFAIMFIYVDLSFLILPPVFALIAYGISFPCSIITKKIINNGDDIKNKLMKFLYYRIFLPIVIIIIMFILSIIISFGVTSIIPNSTEVENIGKTLSPVVLVYILIFISAIFITTPYIQTLIVLLLRKFIKE